jgi:energy-coupling factor transporter ATP-binding protein EcfA2
MPEIRLSLPGGETIDGESPVVIIGPNGSGKTRQARGITAVSGNAIEFVNALRNTRVATEIPAMGQISARRDYLQLRQQSQSTHWELTSDFDVMFSQLLAQAATVALDFTRRWLDNPGIVQNPEITPLNKIEGLWRKVFPGRDLRWEDWKPEVTSITTGVEVKYSGNTMSDGEKAALYLAGKVFIADPNVVMVVDEPETHLHSLLAIKLWNQLEADRPDIRFVYVTHDLTFAMSRIDATYVLASPVAGLRTLGMDDSIGEDVAGAILGSASLSFYASRVVFCEGDDTSIDSRLYNAWFDGADTVVRPVASSHRVLRCVEAMTQGGLTLSLSAVGIVDRDHYRDAFMESLSPQIHPLPVHEVESLFVLPGVFQAVAKHLGVSMSDDDYASSLRASVDEEQKPQLVIQRWKASVEPRLEALVADTSKRRLSVAELTAQIPVIFDVQSWKFSPSQILTEEAQRIEVAFRSDTALLEFLKVVPGKGLVGESARMAGVTRDAYINLVVQALRSTDDHLGKLKESLVLALTPHLPQRRVAPVGADVAVLTPEGS